MHMLATNGPQQAAMGKLDARWKHGYIMGYGKTSNEYCIFGIESKKMTMARSAQRVPPDERWKAEGFENMNVPCQQLYEKMAERAVHAEGPIEDPDAKKHEVGKMKPQRVRIHEDDYKTFGITDDCEKCIHNQRWGYNKSKMIHS